LKFKKKEIDIPRPVPTRAGMVLQGAEFVFNRKNERHKVKQNIAGQHWSHKDKKECPYVE
jgi:hypothetical protein